jgi:hypothetical protein
MECKRTDCCRGSRQEGSHRSWSDGLMHSAQTALRRSSSMGTSLNSSGYRRQDCHKGPRSYRFCSSSSTLTWSSAESTVTEAQWHSWTTTPGGTQGRQQRQIARGCDCGWYLPRQQGKCLGQQRRRWSTKPLTSGCTLVGVPPWHR